MAAKKMKRFVIVMRPPEGAPQSFTDELELGDGVKVEREREFVRSITVGAANEEDARNYALGKATAIAVETGVPVYEIDTIEEG